MESTEGEEEDSGRTTTFLTLASLDFEILHQSRQVELLEDKPCSVIASNSRVVSLGVDCFYLHEVKQKQRKLILLKRVCVDSVISYFNPLSWVGGVHRFSCLAEIKFRLSGLKKNQRPPKGTPFIVVNFDEDLNLVSKLFYDDGFVQVDDFFGLVLRDRLITPVSNGQVVLAKMDNQRGDTSRLFLIDLNQSDVRYFYKAGMNLNKILSCSDKSGDRYFVEIQERCVVLIKLYK